MIILGIDPGLATVGFGVIEADRGRYTVLDYGIISTPKDDTLPVRLGKVESGIETLIKTYKPDQVAVEELFFSKNVTTGIAVAEARGVILLTCNKLLGEEVYEYTPNQIKMTITGYGGAEKNVYVKRMWFSNSSITGFVSWKRSLLFTVTYILAIFHWA